MRLCWGFRVLGLSGLEARVSVCTFSGRDGLGMLGCWGLGVRGCYHPPRCSSAKRRSRHLLRTEDEGMY